MVIENADSTARDQSNYISLLCLRVGEKSAHNAHWVKKAICES